VLVPELPVVLAPDELPDDAVAEPVVPPDVPEVEPPP
jgi:hypothetical protein